MTLQSPTASLIPLFSSSELTGCGYPGLLDRKNRSDMCPRWESNPRLPACQLVRYFEYIPHLKISQVFPDISTVFEAPMSRWEPVNLCIGRPWLELRCGSTLTMLGTYKWMQIQSTLIISTSVISNNHLSRRENLVLV